MKSNRRNFLEASGALLTSAVLSGKSFRQGATPKELPESYRLRQQDRRRELWGLLGDLPWTHRPGPAKLVSKEDHDSYTLERLVLDLNGIEPVPAILLIPKKREPRAPGLLYIHWHGGMYDLGKEQLLHGVQARRRTLRCVQKRGWSRWRSIVGVLASANRRKMGAWASRTPSS
jgi:hypothetical protein